MKKNNYTSFFKTKPKKVERYIRCRKCGGNMEWVEYYPPEIKCPKCGYTVYPKPYEPDCTKLPETWEEYFELYEKVIESYDYNENYYIVLIHAVYDIPGKASDGTEMHDSSEEIYEHILCSICPVNLSKAGLSYDVAENNIKDRIRDWVVSRPETGFLFPVFNDRSTDIHGTLYFNKNIKNIHPDFIENVLGTPIPRIPGNEINVFSDFIMDNFEGNTTFNFTESLIESLQEVREQKKDSPEMITVSCDEMEQIFEYCGVPGEKLSDFKENWETYFSNEPAALDNIHNSKTAKIVTPDATICIQPDKIALIELKEINGVPSLVVPVNGELKINGIEVELK